MRMLAFCVLVKNKETKDGEKQTESSIYMCS